MIYRARVLAELFSLSLSLPRAPHRFTVASMGYDNGYNGARARRAHRRVDTFPSMHPSLLPLSLSLAIRRSFSFFAHCTQTTRSEEHSKIHGGWGMSLLRPIFPGDRQVSNNKTDSPAGALSRISLRSGSIVAPGDYIYTHTHIGIYIHMSIIYR